MLAAYLRLYLWFWCCAIPGRIGALLGGHGAIRLVDAAAKQQFVREVVGQDFLQHRLQLHVRLRLVSCMFLVTRLKFFGYIGAARISLTMHCIE